MRALIVAALSVVVGCCHTPPVPRNVTPLDAVEAHAPESPTPKHEDIERAACAGRDKCRLTDVLDAGSSSSGEPLLIALVAFTEPMDAGAKPAKEVWLLEACGESVRRRRLIQNQYLVTALEESFAVPSPRHLRRTMIFPFKDDTSSVLETATREFSLDPVRIELEYNRTVESGARCDVTERLWSWREFRGTTKTYGSDLSACPATVTKSVPDVRIDGDFVSGGWKTTALGGCALELAGKTARIRAVADVHDVFVEVEDDAFVVSGDKTDGVTFHMRDILDGDRVIRVSMDGHVSSPYAIVQFMEVSPTVRRLHLVMGVRQKLNISYEDTDDGRTWADRISSTTHEDDVAEVMNAAPAFCKPEGGTLSVDYAQVDAERDPSKPLM